jgi:transposase-like protein
MAIGKLGYIQKIQLYCLVITKYYGQQRNENPHERRKKRCSQKKFLEITCPYCQGANFVKRGTRQKKNETVQLYLCNDCQKTFTPGSTKGKHYPISVILDAISLYYIGYSIEKVAERTKKIINANKTDIDTKMLGTGTVLDWINEYEPLCAFARMRPHAIKLFPPNETISSATLAHRQLYRFRHHRAKTILIIQEDWKHSKFWPLKEFLDLVPVECPHQYFQEPARNASRSDAGGGARASETPLMFSKTEMIVRGKHNFANKMAKFVLESVENSKDRHDTLQRFMLANDSVTIATEVPIYLRREDLAHMQTQLGFELYKKQTKQEKDENKEIEKYPAEDLPKLITGHIDFIQVRNGQIHILDYKPNAAKERPIEQLTIYALALSRLTGLKVFNFKCAWFDEKDYFEFFPLHVVHKPGKKRKSQKITTIEGNYKLNDNPKKVENIRPGIM